MNILCFNQTWFAQPWRNQGHHVITCGYTRNLDIVLNERFLTLRDIFQKLPKDFSPDVIIYHDDSSSISILGLETSEIPVVMYAVDTHHHHYLHSMYSTFADLVVVAQRDYLHIFESGCPVHWLPLWASCNYVDTEEPVYDTSFVGTLNSELNPERVAFFEDLKKKSDIECLEGPFLNYFPKSKIVINQTVKGDMNFRIYEAMACGAMLLTEHIGNGQDELFTNGTHFVLYEKGNTDDAASKIQQYLNDEKKRSEIAKRGQHEIRTKHLEEHRAAELMELIETIPGKRNTVRANLPLVLNYISYILDDKYHPDQLKGLSFKIIQTVHRVLQCHEELNEKTAYFCAYPCLLFDNLMDKDTGDKLIRMLNDQYPGIRVLTLSILSSLVNRGLLNEAEELRSYLGLENLEVVNQLYPFINIPIKET